MSSTSAPSDPTWLPILHLGGDGWVGVDESGRICVGDRKHAKREIDLHQPVGLFPLLERPLSVVTAEIEEWEVEQRREPGWLGARLRLDDVATHALDSQSEYWAGLALAWAADLPADDELSDALGRLESAVWASQNLRHAARRLRRQLGERQ